jgi:putative selenium metabolism hydrolase
MRRSWSGTVTAEWDPVSLTQALIRIDALSGDEGRVADLVEEAMGRLGYREIRRDELGNVAGLVGPPGERTALLLDAHMDVVPALGAWSTPPFGGEIRQGRLYGRGAADMKGALGAAICGVADAARTGRLDRQVAVTASVLEETIEGLALGRLLERLRPEFVVICEPSSLTIKHGQRGRIEILLDVRGIPAHAAFPERARNPILLAGEALAAIAAMPLPADQSLGRAIMVPTDITSSPYPSISSIPPAVTIRFDRRTIVEEDCEPILGALRRRLAEIDPGAFEVKVCAGTVRTYTGVTLTSPRYLGAWLFDRDMPLAQAAAASLAELGRKVEYGVYSFCTNGSESAGRQGIPTIGLGPGAEADAHTPDESIALDELTAAAAVYRGLALRIAGGPR